MFGSKKWFPVFLAAAAGGPYLLMSPDALPRMAEKYQQWVSPGTNVAASPSPGSPVPRVEPLRFEEPAAAALTDKATLETPAIDPAFSPVPVRSQPTIVDLREALRFDISPQWVTSRWPEVSSALPQLDTFGMRVTLVTGTALDDLRGTLTYYFDKKNRLQRVQFDGETGDPRKLVSLLTSEHYKLKPVPHVGCYLYLAKWGRKANSALLVRHADVVAAQTPFSRYQVQFEINDARIHYGLSDEFQSKLDHEYTLAKGR